MQATLRNAVRRRSRGVPLQYILGNVPFGNLNILTTPSALIPRPETEAYSERTAKLLLAAWADRRIAHRNNHERPKLRILDLCTGSGCIALLLHSLLKPPTAMGAALCGVDLEILGVDVSHAAIQLAKDNLGHNIDRGLLHPDARREVSFVHMDVLALAHELSSAPDLASSTLQVRAAFNHQTGAISDDPWAVVISNPPYIAPEDFGPRGTTEASVRKYEPHMALVPPISDPWSSKAVVGSGDVFYDPLCRLAQTVQAELLVMEVGGSTQATRLQRIVKEAFAPTDRDALKRACIETWQDDGSIRAVWQTPNTTIWDGAQEAWDTSTDDRAVVVWRGRLADWRTETTAISTGD